MNGEREINDDSHPATMRAKQGHPISVSAWVGIGITTFGMVAAALISYGVARGTATTKQEITEARIGSVETSTTAHGKTLSDVQAHEATMTQLLQELRGQQAADHDSVTAVKAVLPTMIETLVKIQRSVDRIEARQR
jgi:hypothetical protein